MLVTDQLKLDSFGGIENSCKLRCRCRARIHFDGNADNEQRSESQHSEHDIITSRLTSEDHSGSRRCF